LARRSVLSYKAKADSIVVLEDFTFNDHKTKNYVNMLKYLNVCDEKTLLVLHSFEEKIFLSGRNIEQTLVVTATNISTYNLLNAKKVLVTEKAIAAITELLN